MKIMCPRKPQESHIIRFFPGWDLENCGQRYELARSLHDAGIYYIKTDRNEEPFNNGCLNCPTFEQNAWLSVGG